MTLKQGFFQATKTRLSKNNFWMSKKDRNPFMTIEKNKTGFIFFRPISLLHFISILLTKYEMQFLIFESNKKLCQYYHRLFSFFCSDEKSKHSFSWNLVFFLKSLTSHSKFLSFFFLPSFGLTKMTE